MSETDKGFAIGVFTTTVIWTLIAGFFFIAQDKDVVDSIITVDYADYLSCEEDEVFAWQQNGGDYPNDVKWECVPLDNLME